LLLVAAFFGFPDKFMIFSLPVFATTLNTG
jgi:hypothetical protein